jgi:TP901 family phage tail tape measure protein
MALNKISTEIIEVKLEGADKAEKELDGLTGGLEGVEKSTKKVDRATSEAGGGFSKLQAGITTAGAAMAGFQAAAAAAAAAMRAIKAPVNLAMDFERQFAQVKTLNSDIGEDLKNQLLSLAATVPQTAGDLTSATYQAISAGVQPTDVLSFMKAASQAAIAAGGTLTESVEILTAGVNAFGKQGETAASISNKLFSTVKNGVTTIPELNAVFGRAAATASSYGISVDEVLGAIAQLTRQGLPTSEAVTRVNATIKELSNESGKAAKALKKQGVEVGVTALQQKGLVGVLEDVNKATRGQASEVAKLSQRQEAVQGMLMLTGDSFEQYSGLVRTIKTDTTAASDATAVMSATTHGAMKIFEAAKEGALRDLGTEVLPAVKDLFIALTDEIGKSGGAIKALGQVFSTAIKGVGLFVRSLSTVGTAMAAAFGIRYAPMFLAGLAKMGSGLLSFTAMAQAAGRSSGAAFASLFGQTALRGIGAMFAGPLGIAVTSILGSMIFTAVSDASEEAAQKVEEVRTKSAARELAEFMKNEGIKAPTIQKRLELQEREAALTQLRIKAAMVETTGNTKQADSIMSVVAAMEKEGDGQINLAELYKVSASGTKEVLKSLSSQRQSYQDLTQTQDEQIKGAKSLAEQNRILEVSSNKMTAALDVSNGEILQQKSALEGMLQAGAKNIEQINKLEKAREKQLEFFRITGEGQNVIRKTEEKIQGLTEKNAVLRLSYQNLVESLEDNERALSEAQDQIDQNTQSVFSNNVTMAEAAKQYAENKKVVEANVTALDRNIAALRAKAKADKDAAAGSNLYMKAIDDLLKIQIAGAKKSEKDAEKAAKDAENALKRRVKAMQRFAELERKDGTDRASRNLKELESQKTRAQQLITREGEIKLARLDAENSLMPLEEIKQRSKIESDVIRLKYQEEMKFIEAAKLKETELAFSKSTNASLKVKENEKDKVIADEQLDRISATELRDIEAARSRAAVRKDEATKAHEHELKLAELQKGPQLAGGRDEEAAMLQARRDFMLEHSQLMQADRLSQYDVESNLLRQQYQKEDFFKKASIDEQAKMEKAFNASRLKGRQTLAKEMQEIERQQTLSAISATANALGEVGAVADALGASESFVGKIEAAQIVARGIMHGFEGASEQAEAISSFADGNVAGGIAHQAAAIAHFAQAAAAPIMARRAATRSAGGGAGGAQGGGAGAGARGPRTTATQSQPEQRSQGAAIQFGDIVLADVPALLSRNGSRQLGRQIAGDIARELNRQRALPGGARI